MIPSIRRNIAPAEICSLVGDAPLMLEIGAHEGTDTAKFLEAMVGITLHCFEPDPRPIARFKQRIGDDPRVTLTEAMVADRDGELFFWASTGKAGDRDDWDFSGSLSQPTGHYKRSPEIGFKPPVLLPSIRLDTWLAATLQPDEVVDFIWADVQGGQRALIAGGRDALARTRHLYIECHHPEPLYSAEPSREELMALLPEFEPLAFYDCDNILFQNRNL